MSRTKQGKKKVGARPPRRLLALRKRLRKQLVLLQGAYPNRHFIPVAFTSASGVRMYPVTLRAGSPVLGFFKRKVAEEYRRAVKDWHLQKTAH